MVEPGQVRNQQQGNIDLATQDASLDVMPFPLQQLKPQPGELSLDGLQQAGQHIGRDGFGHTQAHRARDVYRRHADRFHRIQHGVLDLLRMPQETRTGFGEAHAAGVPGEQLHAYRFLQALQGGRHGRLRHMATKRRTRHLSCLGDGHEMLQLLQSGKHRFFRYCYVEIMN